MKKFFLTLLAFVIVGAGIWHFTKGIEKSGTHDVGSGTEPGSADVDSAHVGSEGPGEPITTVGGKTSSTATKTTTATTITTTTTTTATTIGGKGTPSPSVTPGVGVANSGTSGASGTKSRVDGDLVEQGDDVILPPTTKAPPPQTLAGVQQPNVWLVASDLKNLPNMQVGVPDGSKASPWKNRAGTKYGDGIRIRGAAVGTYIHGLPTTSGKFDAVAICSPGVKDCINTEATQLKIGLDVNHKDHWLSGSDKVEHSNKGGSSFTALFVAARGSVARNPLIEHQNGEAAGTRGVFLGWIGLDIVGSIHGAQGIVGTSAVAAPNPFEGNLNPQIYTLRFDRKKHELKLFALGSKKSEVSTLSLPKGDGPDNDQYAGMTLGSKNPGPSAVTFVLEQALYSRALSNKELCSIHTQWNEKYALKISSRKLRPCTE